MGRRITVINGHPDPRPERLVHALADAYAAGALAAGHEVRRIDVAALEFPLLARAADWETGSVPPGLAAAQADIGWAEHLVILYPLWLGAMPALLKGFLEQVFRPGFAIDPGARSLNGGRLKGRSARIVVTMGMPALVYRWYFGAHSLKSLERNILRFVGFAPVRATIVGMVGAAGEGRQRRWLDRLRRLGAAGR